MGWWPSSWTPPRFGRLSGRDPNSDLFSWFMSLWKTRPPVDYSRNDYDLWKAVYYCSVYNSKGGDYIRGAATAKPIVNAAAAFAIGQGFEAHVDGADEIPQHQAAEDKLKTWIEDHDSEIFDLTKFAYRDGDCFGLVTEDGEIEDLDPDTVEIRFDPLTGKILGYDITETVEEDSTPYTYIREFRTTGVRYLKLRSGEKRENASVLYQRTYTEDGIVDPDELEDGEDQAAVEMPLPVVHYANEPDRKALYGNSELQSVLIFFKDYNDVMNGAVMNDVYNNGPIPYFTGISVPPADLGKDSAVAIPDANGKAGYLTTDKTADNSGTLLEYIFFNIVQNSETPEFLLGTAIASSKASASEQVATIVAKARRKRRQLKKVLGKLVDAYVFRQMLAGDPDFYALWANKVPISISFPPIVDEDGTLNLDTITMLKDRGIISDKTALELSYVGDRIKDPEAELKQAREDEEASNDRNNVYQDQPGRIGDELDALDDDGSGGGGDGDA